MANPSSITVKTAEEIRDDYLRTIKEGLINLGRYGQNPQMIDVFAAPAVIGELRKLYADFDKYTIFNQGALKTGQVGAVGLQTEHGAASRNSAHHGCCAQVGLTPWRQDLRGQRRCCAVAKGKR